MRSHYCANNKNVRGVCKGERKGERKVCFERKVMVSKGKEKCDQDEKCFGVMLHDHWSKKNNGQIKLCTTRSMKGSARKDWRTFLKVVKGSEGKFLNYS